jgi:hypothetical protein
MLRAGLAMALLIDESAEGIALNRWALPECLHVPIVVDEDAIRKYVGDVERVVSGRGLQKKVLLVAVPKRASIDPLLPISGSS